MSDEQEIPTRVIDIQQPGLYRIPTKLVTPYNDATYHVECVSFSGKVRFLESPIFFVIRGIFQLHVSHYLLHMILSSENSFSPQPYTIFAKDCFEVFPPVGTFIEWIIAATEENGVFSFEAFVGVELEQNLSKFYLPFNSKLDFSAKDAFNLVSYLFEILIPFDPQILKL